MLVDDSKIEIDLLGATSNDYDRYQSMEQLVATRYNMDRSEVVSMPQRIEWSLFKGETTYKDFADTPPSEKFPGDGFMVVVVCVRKGGQYGWFPIEVHHCGFGHRMPSLSFEVKSSGTRRGPTQGMRTRCCCWRSCFLQNGTHGMKWDKWLMKKVWQRMVMFRLTLRGSKQLALPCCHLHTINHSSSVHFFTNRKSLKQLLTEVNLV